MEGTGQTLSVFPRLNPPHGSNGVCRVSLAGSEEGFSGETLFFAVFISSPLP